MPSSNAYKILLEILLFLLLHITIFAQYQLNIIAVDRDSTIKLPSIAFQTSFKSRAACEAYLDNLPAVLQTKGYPAASIDSVHFDSTFASIQLYLGQHYQLSVISTSETDRKILDQSGWNGANFQNKPLNVEQLQSLQWKVLNHLENNGYPFAKIQLDSIMIDQGKIFANLKIDKGPFYKIDSIRIYGNVRISNSFLQHYLEIVNGSMYQKAKLQGISKKILELPYLQEQQAWNITMLGTGCILNLYLQPKKSSQVNILIGLLPSNQQTVNNKLLVTGEANINLRNALGNGELLGLNWQQIQLKSPRLNIVFQQPYIFATSFGISTTFDLFKKDSSYLNLDFLLGIQYSLGGEQAGKIFIENLKTSLLNVDTLSVKSLKKLPEGIDVSSINLGLSYEINKTNYRLNPKKGSELQVTISAGTRNIKKNNVIAKLYDPAFSYASLYDSIKQNTYQFRLQVYAAHYFPSGRQSTFKTAIHTGWFQSPSIFRNELFQIGGYKLLRGFDEESIFASRYAVSTLEYRFLTGLNSFLFSFLDAGWVSNTSNNSRINNNFLGGGLGMAFETKAGVFNISFAAGKRNDARLNIRQSKIHIGYVNYF